MSTMVAPKLMTTEDLLAIPDDGIERWLINGELREGDVTRRNYKHSRVESKFDFKLREWLELQPEPRGDVVVGEAGFVLREDPAISVGTDVAYIDADLAQACADAEGMIHGVPVLVVEIMSPSDEHLDVVEKIAAYLDCGVKIVWIVDPDHRTVTVHRPDRMPELFNVSQTITAEPHLPGFSAAVASFFSR